MTHLSRVFPALAALGAGLIYIAVGAGAPLVLEIIFVAFGVYALVWAVATLGTDRLLAPRVSVVVALLPVVVWGGVVVAVPDVAFAFPFVSMAVGSVFSLFVATSIGVVVRRGARGEGTGRPVVDGAHPMRQGRAFVGLFVGAAVVAALTTPALSFTLAGDHAQPHGEHGGSAPGEQSHHTH